MKIKNCPDYVNKYEYVVAREVDGEFWFYGAYDDIEKAREVAAEINGIAFVSK